MPIYRLVQKRTGLVVVEIKSVQPEENVKEQILYELMRRWDLKLEEYAADSEVR